MTGDRGVSDEEGYLWFVGRADDVILSSAYRIGPFEVESALLEHPAVAESAVVGAPDADRGEIVKAFVVLRHGFDPTADLIGELQEHVKTVTAPYKYPREVAFVDELPKTREREDHALGAAPAARDRVSGAALPRDPPPGGRDRACAFGDRGSRGGEGGREGVGQARGGGSRAARRRGGGETGRGGSRAPPRRGGAPGDRRSGAPGGRRGRP